MYETDNLVQYITNNINQDKVVFIINGNGGSGKDYLIQVLQSESKLYVKNESVIDPVKNMMYKYGSWDGIKDEKGRKLLSDVKKALDEYSDFTSNYIIDKFNLFIKGDYDVLFIHCGNLKQINTLKELFTPHCRVYTLFVESSTGGCIDDPRYDENDEFDKNRDKSQYDLYFYNSYELYEPEKNENPTKAFINLIISKVNGVG